MGMTPIALAEAAPRQHVYTAIYTTRAPAALVDLGWFDANAATAKWGLFQYASSGIPGE